MGRMLVCVVAALVVLVVVLDLQVELGRLSDYALGARNVVDLVSDAGRSVRWLQVEQHPLPDRHRVGSEQGFELRDQVRYSQHRHIDAGHKYDLGSSREFDSLQGYLLVREHL